MLPSDPPPVAAPESPRGPRPALAPALLFAVLSALASWGAGQLADGRFEVRLAASGGFPSRDEIARQNAAVARSQAQTAAVVFATLGGLLAMSLGVLGGWSRSRPGAAIVGGVLGLLAGASAAAGLALVVFPPYLLGLSPGEDSLLKSSLLHGGYWGAVGLVAGAMFGLAQGGGRPASIARSALGGAIGGLLGGVLFQVVGGIAFPLDRTIEPFPTATTIGAATGAWSRLAGRLLAAVPIALGATGLNAPPAPAAAPVPAAVPPHVA